MSDNALTPFLTPHFSHSAELLDYAQGVTHQRLIWPIFEQKKLTVYLRRDDLASTHYPGNKWYKLFYNLQALVASGQKTVVSFGGAYSNHIHALAAMGKAYGLNIVGIIRGYKPSTLSPTLQDAQAWGMRLLFLGHSAYRDKDISQYQAQLIADYGDYYCIPEGGENMLGVNGCQAIAAGINHHFTGKYTVCSAIGTGTTFAGIVSAVPEQVSCIGFSVLKGDDTLTQQVKGWLDRLASQQIKPGQLKPRQSKPAQWHINNDYHHGGYAKTSPELLSFMAAMEKANKLLLEPVYSAKMLWGIDQLAQQNYWPEGSIIIAVHGGGIQGRRGFGL